MSTVKNQHYVPKFYLRNFSNNNKNIGMFRYKDKSYIPNASIKSVAYSKFLYGEDGELEHLLSKFESQWAEIMRKIIKLNFESLIELDILKLYDFILISKSRTKKVADETNFVLNYLKELIPEEGIHNSSCNMDRVDFEESMKIPNLIPITASLENNKYMFDLDAIILENKTNYDFITSDSPVIFYNQLYIWRNYKINYGLVASGLQIFIPLSPKKVLCFYDSEVYKCLNESNGVINLISKKQITEINKLTVYNSYDQLFFSCNSKENYISELARYKTLENLEEVVTNYKNNKDNGELIKIGKDSIHEKIKLDFFQINNKYKTIKLPNNCGGLRRTYVKALEFYKKTI
ncbi:DUF4238 domain-containing protein [Clostridium aquiflavi]|uniref:DUF4238 domain-containing protein n=1 Tax=Clostridium aquiflavi TaxID=3073603 RepID=A0ABU1ECJ9_9CLOT|nr:DUF4238 domain-containing protein [Clostridium sp. 5N-1]MDR5586107.1 DUF4238 domain-containing protein [Clostridium sp. 5N-1]